MRGIWVWPSEPKDQDKTLQKILREDGLVAILIAFANNPEGLSNAQLDRLLANNSQWRTLFHMKELMALGFVDYHVQLFGDAGKYQLTDLGKAIVSRIQANQ
jgi:hypothetical protein